jgi:hypothetical protein
MKSWLLTAQAARQRFVSGPLPFHPPPFKEGKTGQSFSKAVSKLEVARWRERGGIGWGGWKFFKIIG